MNVETRDVEVHDASFDRLQQLPLFVMPHEVLHDSGCDASQLVAHYVRLKTLEKCRSSDRVAAKLVIDPAEENVPSNESHS